MTQLGKYDIIEEIGRGGFGVVYRALDISLQVERALKVLHPTLTVDPQVAARFMREAQVAAGLDHPHIVPVYDIGESDGRTYLAMKLMPGGSLKDRLAADGKLPFDQALDIISQVSRGLEAAHQRNIIHRDLKPGNILFGEFGRVRVSDFGFAKVLSETASASLTMSGVILGTPAYMAPELWNGSPPPSPATDVYALACVLYEMLTGEVLFDGESPMAVIAQHAHGPDFSEVVWPNHVPESLVDVLIQALLADPMERCQDTNHFLEKLNEEKIPAHDGGVPHDNKQVTMNEQQLQTLEERKTDEKLEVDDAEPEKETIKSISDDARPSGLEIGETKPKADLKPINVESSSNISESKDVLSDKLDVSQTDQVSDFIEDEGRRLLKEIPDPVTQHRRQRFWQIIMPVGIILIISLIVLSCVISTAVVTDAGGPVSQWMDTSLIWISLPVMLISVVISIGLFYLIHVVSRINRNLPEYINNALSEEIDTKDEVGNNIAFEDAENDVETEEGEDFITE